ncbi:MAG: hypothetical protein IID44_30135 [Planctomycetes bacterium]|nr:hypothetical protein [Planctomycetota bacterium]
MLPAYAGLLGSMGLAFLLQNVYLLPITVVAMVVVVGALGFRANRRRGYGPLVLGVVAASLLLVGKFALDMAPMLYAGIVLLIVASVWNSWPVRAKISANS